MNIARQSQGAQRSVLILVDMKDLKTGRKDNYRFDGEEKLNAVKLETKYATVLYKENKVIYCMDSVTFEQYEVPSTIVEGSAYITDGMRLSIGIHENEVLRVEMPNEVLVTIRETQQNKVNSTNGNTDKKATLTNGCEIKVPGYCLNNQQIWIKPKTGEFIKRADT